MANGPVTIDFTLVRDTKNTVRYQEVPSNPKAPEELVVGSLYVQKRALREIGDGDFPPRLTVTIQN